MDGTVFLHIAAVFDDDLSPIAPDRGTGPDVTMSANINVPGHSRLGMNKRGFVNDGDYVIKRIDHRMNCSLIPASSRSDNRFP